MKTNFQQESALVDDADASTDARPGLWARWITTGGAIAWTVIAVVARLGFVPFGQIELLFLFAPLVIIPLGIELHRATGQSAGLLELAQRLQPVGAILAVWACWYGPGLKAGIAAGGWMIVCILIAADGLVWLIRSVPQESRRLFGIAMSIARIDLAVGGAWLVASRLGLRPMGIQEPIGLLTAVHFHFAGFATATIAAATLQCCQQRLTLQGSSSSLLRFHLGFEYLVLVICVLPYLVALGFVISPVLKMSAAVLFSSAVAMLALFLRNAGLQARDSAARLLLQVAAGAVFLAMMLAVVYAVGDLAGHNTITIPQMSRTHGILNSVGFCLCGLLGWLVDNAATYRNTNFEELP